ncbi:iron-siderophore ABC transporter substrate-binding protein [Bacillus sp. P14.5]|uniref:ABC transporter substrate-binding protein n=1 Tax=Bacillus sp. P14.5 TaxID=1983400 RepID=UPI000DE85578|nr:iron-siderophore ABC transporter substrate-binding protein [Bacillus sp. P14.5]
MKKFSLFCIFTSLLILLAACGGNENEAADTTENETVNEEPRVVSHLRGETEIPESLEKVVVLSPAYIDHMLAIDETPAGVTIEAQFGGDYIPYLADQLDGVEVIGSSSEPNLETILSIEPDLIISDSWTAESIYDDLNKIAPTVVLGTEDSEDYNDPDYWQQDLLKIAEIFDKVDAAEEKIAELETKVAEAGEVISEIESNKLAYLRIRKDVVQIYPQTGHPLNFLLYNDLGFTPSDLTDESERGDLSLEVIPDMKADYIFLQVDSSGGPENLQSISDSSLWQSLAAVQNDKVFETDFWIYKSWGLIGRDEIIDEVLEFMN